jgi:hypothetical protein
MLRGAAIHPSSLALAQPGRELCQAGGRGEGPFGLVPPSRPRSLSFSPRRPLSALCPHSPPFPFPLPPPPNHGGLGALGVLRQRRLHLGEGRKGCRKGCGAESKGMPRRRCVQQRGSAVPAGLSAWESRGPRAQTRLSCTARRSRCLCIESGPHHTAARNAHSTSAVPMRWPLTLITSSTRPVILRPQGRE